jgi:uncharacterized protein YbaR (Trm112 family)
MINVSKRSAVPADALIELLECPTCHGGELATATDGAGELACRHCGECYPLFNGHPVLISANNRVFPRSAYLASPEASVDTPLPGLGSRVAEALAWRINCAFRGT